MFGEKIKFLRLRNKMTQKGLAEAIGVSQRSLINYETGRCYPRQASVVAKLAESLHVSADYLLSEQDSSPPFDEEEEAREAERLVHELKAVFAGGKLKEADRDAAMEALLQAYWDGRRIARMSQDR